MKKVIYKNECPECKKSKEETEVIISKTESDDYIHESRVCKKHFFIMDNVATPKQKQKQESAPKIKAKPEDVVLIKYDESRCTCGKLDIQEMIVDGVSYNMMTRICKGCLSTIEAIKIKKVQTVLDKKPPKEREKQDKTIKETSQLSLFDSQPTLF